MPFGATALVEPVTVAVKDKVPPKVGVPVGTRVIVGVAGATRVVVIEGEAERAK